MSEYDQPKEALRLNIEQWFQTNYFRFKENRLKPIDSDREQALREKREVLVRQVADAIIDGSITSQEKQALQAHARGWIAEIMAAAMMRGFNPDPRYKIRVGSVQDEPADIIVSRSDIESGQEAIIGGIDAKASSIYELSTKAKTRKIPIIKMTLNPNNFGYDQLMKQLAMGDSPEPDSFINEHLFDTPTALASMVQSLTDSTGHLSHTAGDLYQSIAPENLYIENHKPVAKMHKSLEFHTFLKHSMRSMQSLIPIP